MQGAPPPILWSLAVCVWVCVCVCVHFHHITQAHCSAVRCSHSRRAVISAHTAAQSLSVVPRFLLHVSLRNFALLLFPENFPN